MKRDIVFAVVVSMCVASLAAPQAFEDVSADNIVRSQTEESVFGGSFTDLDRDGDRDVLLFVAPWSVDEVAPEAKDSLAPSLDGIGGNFDDDEDRDFILANAAPFGDFSMDAAPIDADGDGDWDVMVALEFYPNRLFINDGHGVLTEESSRLPRAMHDSEDIAVADFDGDGDQDAIVVTEDDETNEYYLNDGTGRFHGAGHLLPAHGVSNGVTAFDVDLDGSLDLVIANRGQNYILLNDGTGSFRDETGKRLPDQDETTQDVAVGDVDGDGDADMVFANEKGLDRMVLNDGKGVFAPAPEGRVPPPPTATDSRDVELVDVDGDGDLDLFFGVVGWGQEQLKAYNRLLINDGSGAFSDETESRLPGPNDDTLDGVFLDLDGDGDLDLVSNHSQALRTGNVRVWENDGSGRFTDVSAGYLPDGVSGIGLAVVPADISGDGTIDLYLANRGRRDRLLLRRK